MHPGFTRRFGNATLWRARRSLANRLLWLMLLLGLALAVPAQAAPSQQTNTAPTISAIPNVTTAVGIVVLSSPFSIWDTQTAARQLTLTAASSNLTLLPVANITIIGSDTVRTLRLTPAAGQSGTATVTITVSDGALSSSTNFTLTVSTATPASRGLSWLRTVQASDGSWADREPSRLRDTLAVVQAFAQLAVNDDNFKAAGAWAAQRRVTVVDDVARKTLIVQATGRSTSGLDTLILNQRGSYTLGFGYSDKYESDIISTALAIKALEATGRSITNPADQGVFICSLVFLMNSQTAAGGWGYARNDDPRASITALVLETLWTYRGYSGMSCGGSPAYTVQTEITEGQNWLKAQQQAGGNWAGDSGSVVLNTAIATVALYNTGTTPSNTAGAKTYLTNAQQSNGSWQNSVYATALAVRAMHRLP